MGTQTKTKRAKNQNSKGQKQENFFGQHSRLWKWIGRVFIGIALIILATFIWFRASPWPGAMLIRAVFNHNDLAKSLQTHTPSGIVTLSDQQYKLGDKTATLDVHMPESAQASGIKLPVVIWTHGGAWLSGDKSDWAPYFKLIAKAGYTVIAPNYSLAPQKTYPTAVHQLNAMHAYIQENVDRFHADTSKIVFAGDSAGSQLSAQMAALITNPAYAQEVGIIPALKPEQLRGVVLNCGIYKMEELAHPNQNLPKILGWGDDVTVWAYSGTHDFSDPVIRQMSPHYHVTKDFPPVFITGGNADPLTDVQSKPFADELESLGVSVTRLFYEPNHTPSLPHEYQFNLNIADGQNAFNQIVAFIADRTK